MTAQGRGTFLLMMTQEVITQTEEHGFPAAGNNLNYPGHAHPSRLSVHIRKARACSLCSGLFHIPVCPCDVESQIELEASAAAIG